MCSFFSLADVPIFTAHESATLVAPEDVHHQHPQVISGVTVGVPAGMESHHSLSHPGHTLHQHMHHLPHHTIIPHDHSTHTHDHNAHTHDHSTHTHDHNLSHQHAHHTHEHTDTHGHSNHPEDTLELSLDQHV